ncbi:MAG: NIPSNAP family protein, partial [Bacteroidetes bacterium]|nr:NIPSNAP family protein [Bacteroidota bacterium]
QMQLPALKSAHEEHIYELRSYESATEKLNVNKVQMFNTGGEIALFKRLGFNAIFYAGVISGSHMPNLMYMTSFENRAARDEHWKTFGDDAEWKKLKALPEYQNNVSHADIVLCHATPYSDL